MVYGKKMKILLIDNASLTPVNSALCCEPKTGEFAKELQALGNKVTMYGQIVESENIHAFNIQENGITVVGHHRRKLKIFNYILLYLLIIPQIFKSDFIYIFYPSAFKYIAVLCWIFRKKYGLYIRGQNNLTSRSSNFIYRKSNVIFTVTEYFTQYVKSITLKENVFSIKPMINLDDRDIISDRNHFKKEKLKVLFLARIEKDKGIEEFLYAILELIEKYQYKFEVDIVGEGGFLKKAIDISSKIGISESINFKGAVFDTQKIKDFYLKADIYILPTYHEGFPRTLYEAMIYGTPIITTFVGGIPYLMKDKFNCLKIEPKSVESIVDALVYSINNYEKMLDCAKNAQTTVKPIIRSSRLSHAEALHHSLCKL